MFLQIHWPPPLSHSIEMYQAVNGVTIFAVNVVVQNLFYLVQHRVFDLVVQGRVPRFEAVVGDAVRAQLPRVPPRLAGGLGRETRVEGVRAIDAVVPDWSRTGHRRQRGH